MQKRSCEERAGMGVYRVTKAAALMVLLAGMLPVCGVAQMSTTTVQGTVYRADGTPASGTLLISWPAFTTAQDQAVAAGNLNASIGANGFVSVNLTPNAGGLPSGTYYTATYHLNDGSVDKEYWVVPASGTATIGAVRAELQPSTVAVQSTVTPSYVQSAIASLSGTYLPLSGGTLSGSLTLEGDPVTSSQAATKRYADQLAAQNLPLSGGALNGPLTAPSFFTKQLEGRLYADQWQSGASSNNGIAMSLSQCASLPYACQVLAPALYAQSEAQPFGGANGNLYPPQTNGPKSTDPAAEFLDQRFGVPQNVFNGSSLYDSRHGNWPNYTMNFIGNASMNGTFAHPAGALHLQSNFWAGGRNFYNDKTNLETLDIREQHYTQAQGGGSIGQSLACYGNGDCIGEAMDTFSYGGPNTAADEGAKAWRIENIEGGQVFGATIASLTTATDGSTTLATSSQTANGTQGEGRLVIDLTKVYNSGYISNITVSGGNEEVTCSGCTWDSTFGTSTQTTLAAPVQNSGSTNSFPQSNTVLSVASSTGFTVGNVACIFDYDYECEKITAISTGAVTIATDRLPHPTGAYVTTGGLTGYAMEFEADRVSPSNTNGVSISPDSGLQQTVRKATPIMYSASGNAAYLFSGGNQLPGHAGGNGDPTRAYTQMSGNGGTCSVSVSGGQLAGVTVSGGTGYNTSTDAMGRPLNPPQLVLSGITSRTAPVIGVSWISGGALAGATISSAGSGISGTPTCAVVTSNPYDIYPAAKTTSVYNQTTGAVDGTLYTEPFSGTAEVNDAIEQPHYFYQHVGGDGDHVVGQYIPSLGSEAKAAIGYSLTGIWQGNDTAIDISDASDPSLFGGYPSTPNIPGRGQLVTPVFGSVDGAWRMGWYFKTPPFASNLGYDPAALFVGCGSLPCSSWTNPYWLAGGNAANGVAGVEVTPSTGTVAEVAPAAGSTSCSTSLTGGTSGGFAVTCSGHTSKFDASGSLALAGSVNAAKINGEITVDGSTYTSVNAAWTAAAAQAIGSGQNQTVRLGPGTYPVTATLTEPTNGACVNLLGSGGTTMNADSAQIATTLTVPSALNGDVVSLGNTTQAQGCTFKDFNLLAGGNATHGFELQWFRGLLIDNVTVNDTTAEGMLLGEEDTSAGHQASFLLRNVTVSYSSAAFTPANRPAYGIHLQKTAIDSHLDDVVVRNALTAAVYNEGTGNTGYLIHGFGYPYTCSTAPCANNASSGSASNASYATSYVIYDVGGGGSVWTDTYVDSPATAGFYIGANGVAIHGGHIQWPDVTSFPSANLAYVAANVSNNLLIADVDCLEMAAGVNWITYAGASGNPPSYASVHHLTGCGNYYQALEPANTSGFSSGGANINDPSGAVPRVWSTPIAAAASYPAFSAQMYTGYQGDAFQAHFSGVNPFFNVTYQGTIRTNGGIALSTVTNTASTLTLTPANKNVIADASGGAQTITLPSCYTPLPDRMAPTGLEFTIIKSDTSANAVTLATTSSQTIYNQGVGASTLVLSGPSTETLVCGPDSNWYVAGSTASGSGSASAPHMTWYGSFAGTFGTSTNNSLGAIWSPTDGVNMTRLDIAVGTAPTGCTTWPAIGIYDSTAGAWLKTVTLASGTYRYRNAVSAVAVPAGHNLSMGVQTAGAGCTTNAGSAQLTMEYTMQ